MLCSKQGGKTSQKELRTLKAVLSPALASLYESEVLPLLNYILLKVRLRDAEGKVIETRHAIRRTETYLANAVADEQRARAGSKKADRAAHLVEKHTNVLRKHESAASRAEDTVARTRAAFEREQGAVALSTLFDPFDDVSEHRVGGGGSGATEQGTPTARDRGDADDEDVSDAVFPSAKKPRTASSPHVAPCPHISTPTPSCVLPLERTDVMTCILAYLSCGDALNGLGMASRATRAAVMGAATSVSISQGSPCTFLGRFPRLQHLTVVHSSTTSDDHDWWRDESTAWHTELARHVSPRLVTLNLLLDVYIHRGPDVTPLCDVDWPHLRHLHVQGGNVAMVLRAIVKARRPSAFASLEAVGCEAWKGHETTALDNALRAGCLPRFRSLHCPRIFAATTGNDPHPEVYLDSVDVTPQLHVLKMAAQATRGLKLSFPTCARESTQWDGGWQSALPPLMELLRGTRFPQLRHLTLAATREVVRQVLECLLEVGVATHLHSLNLSVRDADDPPPPPQQQPPPTLPTTWLLPPGSFPALTTVQIGGACTREGLVAVLGACGTRLQSIHLCDGKTRYTHAIGSDHLSALHTVVCGFGGGDGADRTSSSDCVSTEDTGGVNPPLWATSVTQLRLTVPDAKLVTDATLALSLKKVLTTLPLLQKLRLSCGRDGAVVGVLEAKHAGALNSLRQLDFGSTRPYGPVDALSNGAGLLLLAWLKKERHGLAKGLKVAEFWGDQVRRDLVMAVGLSCWIPKKLLR